MSALPGVPFSGPTGPQGLDRLPPKPAWMDEGLCFGSDPDLWYPTRGENEAMKAAQAICRRCPYQEPCLEYALTVGEKWGIWGGESERSRRRIRKQRRREAKASQASDAA